MQHSKRLTEQESKLIKEWVPKKVRLKVADDNQISYSMLEKVIYRERGHDKVAKDLLTAALKEQKKSKTKNG